MTSTRSACASDALAHHERWLLSICKEGVRQLAEFRASDRSPNDSGPYLLGATIYALPDVESAVAEQRVWSWEPYGRMLRSLREGGIAPHWPRDRYRHLAACYARVFGERMWSRFSELRWPVEPADASRVRHEIDSVLPALALARAERDGGEPSAARRAVEEIERDSADHGLHGEVRELALECCESLGSASAASRAASELGFARTWRIGAPIEELDDPSRARVRAIEDALSRGPGAWVAERDGAQVLHIDRGAGADVVAAGLEGSVEHTTARPDGRVDLGELFGSGVRSPASVVAACVVISPDERAVDLGVGRDDDIRVLLDGREVFRAEGPSSVHTDDGWARVHLRRGENLLALRVRNLGGDFGFSLRLARTDGLGDPALRVRAPHGASARASGRVIWSIGTLDGSYDELALARQHERYAALFPDDVHFTVGKSQAARDWSFVQPAARDAWAGSRVHPFTIRFRAPASRARRELRIATVSQNGWTPPTLRVELDGRATDFALPGGSDDALTDPRAARPCVLHVPIGPDDLRAGDDEIVLTIVEGSWVLYDAVEFVECAD